MDDLVLQEEWRHLADDRVATRLREVLANVDQVYTCQNHAMMGARASTHPGTKVTEAIVAKQRAQALGPQFSKATPRVPIRDSTRTQREEAASIRATIKRIPKENGLRYLKPMSTTQERYPLPSLHPNNPDFPVYLTWL